MLLETTSSGSKEESITNVLLVISSESKEGLTINMLFESHLVGVRRGR